jgi:sphingomyelin phosphodiesterase
MNFGLLKRNYHKNADEVVAEGCTGRCRSNMLCRIVTTDIADQSKCDQIRHQIFSHPEF